MTKRSSPEDVDNYLRLRSDGFSQAAAAKQVGYSTDWGRQIEREIRGGTRKSNGAEIRAKRAQMSVGRPMAHRDLDPEAKACLEDFGRFRARYLGRISTPWQEDAAHKVAGLLATPEKEFLVINVAPGSGKTTLFQHDIPLWLTCRNRAIRGMMGHRVQTIANTYAGRLKRTLERTVPMQAKDDEKQKGLALDALSSVAVDYGRFKPEDSSIWTRNSFTVAQLVETPTDEKESTWTAFGMDSGFLGYRVDFANWDDLVANKTMRNEQSIEDQRIWWDTEGESRLEPGGLLCLVGQRLSSVDLYRYCLDKEAGVEELDFEEDELNEHGVIREDRRKKYHHIVYKAHDETICHDLSPKEQKELHRPTAPYWQPDGTGGCLLDPRRVTWRDIRVAQVNPLSRFETVYQQQDVDPRSVLVNPIWVAGGRGLDGSTFPGCWDSGRGEWEWPATAGQQFDTVTVDPSPTKWWSIQFWNYTQDESMPHLGGLRYLISHLRQVMDAPTFLDFNVSNRTYSGVAEEWWQLSKDKGHPYTRLIVEENAAQRFMLQYDHVKRWASMRNVQILGHSTHRNKSDPELGIQTVAPHWMYGRVRLPGKRDDPGRLGAMKLVEEVTKWPDGGTDDCVPAGTMVTTRSGPRPIEAIVGGEQVLTHKGRWREVERVGKRPEPNALYTVKAAGALPLRLTGNHRLLVCKGWRESYSKQEMYDPTDAEWVAAEDLVVGERHSREPIALVTPFDSTVEEPEGVTEDFALLVGLYLAEGSCSDHAVHIACHVDHAPIHEFVERAMAERFGAKTKGYRGGNGLALCTQSVAAKAYFARFGKSSEKRLPDEMMRWPANLQRAIVRGWLIGDGTAAGETQVGGTSISRPLLWQMETLTARLGLRSTLRLHQEPREYFINGCRGQSKRSWTLTIPSAVVDKSDPLDAWRWPGLRDPSHRNSGIQVHDGMMLRKLRTVIREPWSGTVYNLQVDQDESYVAEGVAVHNCVMAHWFHEYNLPNFVAEQLQMPSIYKDLRKFNRWRKGAA